MTWIDLPVTGADLIQILGRRLRVSYHVGRLRRLDIVMLAETRPESHSFRLR